jgi:hypothetical protein
MFGKTIWYTIDDWAGCTKPNCFTTVNVNAGAAADIAESFKGELAYVTGVDADRIKVWVE